MQKLLTAALFLFGIVLGVHGQAGAGQGAILGEVKDPSGASVPKAKVEITNAANGFSRSTESNEAGQFSMPTVPPSSGYIVSVSAAGFAPWKRNEIAVQVGQNVSLNVDLAVATAATEVQVTAATVRVDETKTEVSGVIGNREIMDLPVNGRRFDSFALLTPGVTTDGIFGLVTFRGMALGSTFLTDGNDTTNQYYQEAPGRTRISSQISQDAVQEFQVISAGYMPEFGRASSGVINTVTRSGSNDIHGTFFWFFRNRTLNARDPYAAFNPPEYRHQTGGSLGGPIIKDKLFFFANSEITRRNNPIASSITGAAINPATHGFNGCGLPATPEQCAAADAIVARNFGTIPRRADQELFFAKLDWRPTERHSFTASGNYLRFISPNGIQTAAALTNGSALGNNADSTVRVRYAKLGYTAIVSPTMVNEFRFGWFKDRQYDTPNQSLVPPFGLASLTVNGITNLGIGQSYPRLLPSEQRFQFADTYSWIKGRHTMKFGFDFANNQDVTDQVFNGFGLYTYSTVTNFAQDLSGNTTGAKRWQSYSQALGIRTTDFTTRDYSFFAQDQFRVTNAFTVNYGIRYDYSQLPQPKVSNPDYPQTAKIPTYGGQIGPRIGFAYAFNKSRTVLRVGYGLFHSRYGGGILQTLLTQNGVYQKTVTFTGTVPSDLAAGPIFPNHILASDKPASGTVNVLFAAPDFRPNYTENGDVSLEHQLTRDLTLTVSYLYNRGLQIITTRDLNIGALSDAPVTYRINDGSGNQIDTYSTRVYQTSRRVDTRYSRVIQVESGGKSWYDGMAVAVKGKMGRDVIYNIAYTWSHAIDLGQGQGDDNVNRFGSQISLNNLYNGDYRADKGDGQLDQRHRFVFSWVAQHNFTKRTDAFSKYVLNNWQLSGVLTFSSERPTFATINIVNQITGLGLPFFSLDGFGGDTRVPFLPVNAGRLDGINKLDARITKNLPISERFKLSLNFEAFNVTNSPWNTNIGSGTSHNAYSANNGVLTPISSFGVGTASAAPPDGTNARRAQVSLRLGF
jgi:outer membrane receptor for ferrienterochelin and colicin